MFFCFVGMGVCVIQLSISQVSTHEVCVGVLALTKDAIRQDDKKYYANVGDASGIDSKASR